MGTWQATQTVNAVAQRVKRQFGDESGVQVTDEDIFRWVNDGQRELVTKNDILRARSTTDIVAGQSDYIFPEQILKIVSMRYAGRRLKYLSFQDYEQHVAESDPDRTATGDPEYWTEWAGTFRFYPTPSSNRVTGLEVNYIQMPPPITSLNDSLAIPDLYFNALVHYVLSQAYEQDEDWVAAGNKTAQFEASANTLLESENAAPDDYYPFITEVD